MFYVAEIIDFEASQVAISLQKHNPDHLPIHFSGSISDGIISWLCSWGSLRQFEIRCRATTAAVTRNTYNIELRQEARSWRVGVQQEPSGNCILLIT